MSAAIDTLVPPTPPCPAWCSGHPNAAIDRWDEVDVRDSGLMQATSWCEAPIGVVSEDDEPLTVIVRRFVGWYRGDGLHMDPPSIWIDDIALAADAATNLAALLSSAATTMVA